MTHDLPRHGPAEIDLYTAPTPNGRKISIFLEEAELPYNLVHVDNGKGEQHSAEFLRINPNGKIPAIVDHKPLRVPGPLPMFESGAILLYLADRTGLFMPKDEMARWEALQWLMWQMGGFGPMLGQAHHFRFYAPETIDYAVERYTREARRLYNVLEARLAGRNYIVGDYSIADMAVWPWIVPRKLQGVTLDDYPNISRWNDAMKARPGVRRGFDALRDQATADKPSGEAWRSLFGRPA